MEANIKLIDAAIEAIRHDIESGDVTAIAELLTAVPEENLRSFLPESGVKDQDTLWSAWISHKGIRLSMGYGAYQWTEMTVDQAKELGNTLVHLSEQKQQYDSIKEAA